MSITRNVVIDLLPVYFSGEASDDTRKLVEDFFREDPDFERVARSAATPLETLKSASPVAPEAEREKCDLERIGWELRLRGVWLVLALFYTLRPLAPLFGGELAGWIGRSHTWGGRIADLAFAAFFWLVYITRMPRRKVLLAAAIFVSSAALAVALNKLNIITSPAVQGTNLEIIIICVGAAFFWFLYFRGRTRVRR